MILGNQTWQAGLSAQQKQPLYAFTIPQFGIVLTTFTASQIQPPGGWGVTLWGVGGWGT